MKHYEECPICKGTESKELRTCKDNTGSKETFSIVACPDCGFEYTNPIPLEDQIGKYYESEEYVSHSNTSKGVINSLYQLVRAYTLKQKLRLINKNTLGKKLLDIGCGTGEFLNICSKNGYNTLGVEPSNEARKQAIENFKLNVIEEQEMDEIEADSFDVISMWHVLEHVYHLNKRVEEIYRILKPGGKLIVAVPNRTSFDALYYQQYWAAYDLPRHLYHYSPENIKTLFSNHNFKLTQILPMKFDSYYVSMLSEKYKNQKSGLFNAIRIGWLSNFKAFLKKDNSYSSQIYILEKLKR